METFHRTSSFPLKDRNAEGFYNKSFILLTGSIKMVTRGGNGG
jgi:hypothetical protein